ncbi:MAG: pentapeptide repeat-containing protein [Nitrosarchaeum sp.]
MLCKHNFQYSQGHFQCSKCGKRASERQYKRNHNKSYAVIVIVGILILSGIYVYANYNTTFNDKDSSAMLPVTMIQQTIDDVGNNTLESIKNTANDISESIPIKIEPKSETESTKLDRCSNFNPGADLSYCDLHGMDFHNAHFYNTNLSNANLAGTNLFHADLRNVDFRNADLSNADLRYANLNGADLRNADLSGAKLDDALLSGTKFR